MADLNSLYNQLLGRDIGAEGQRYWGQQLKNGMSLSDIQTAIKQSDEYKQRQQSTTSPPVGPGGLPRTVTGGSNPSNPSKLGMTPSVTDTVLGDLNWRPLLGTSANSGSNLGLSAPQPNLNQLYNDLLGRNIGQEGSDYWGQQLNNGMSLSDIQTAITQSDEYKQRQQRQQSVGNLYQDYFGRAPDTEGLEYWTNSGLSTAQIQDAFAESPEAKQVLEGLYTDVLRRDSDAAGMDYWLNQMRDSDMTLDQIRNSFLQSEEYKNRDNPYAEANLGITNASDLLRGIGQYTPEQVQGTSYDPSQVATTDLSAYMNPYTQQVINRSMADLERARQGNINNLGFSAGQAGAFGGSRHGVAEALTNEGFANQAGNLAAGLRQNAFNTALGQAQYDVGAQNAALQFGATQNMNAQQLNQAAGLQNQQVKLGAAAGLLNASDTGFDQAQTINNTLFNQGLAQQQLYQQALNAAMGQYGAWAGYPAYGVGLTNTMLPGQVGSTTTGTANPGLLPALGWGLGLGGKR